VDKRRLLPGDVSWRRLDKLDRARNALVTALGKGRANAVKRLALAP